MTCKTVEVEKTDVPLLVAGLVEYEHRCWREYGEAQRRGESEERREVWVKKAYRAKDLREWFESVTS